MIDPSSTTIGKQFTIFSKIDPIKLYRSILKLSHLLCGVPKCKHTKLMKVLSNGRLPEVELRFYKFIEEPLRKSQLIYFLLTLWFCLVSSYYSIYMIHSVGTLEVNKDLQMLPDEFKSYRGAPITGFGCLLTNCTSSTTSKPFVRDLVGLPLFAICKPELNRYYLPLTGLDALGLSIYTVYTYFIFLVGVAFVGRSYLHPTLQESSVFPITPIYLGASLREQTQTHLIELSKSLRNYLNALKSRPELMCRSRRLRSKDLMPSEESYSVKHEQGLSVYKDTGRSFTELLKLDPENMDPIVLKQVADCIPITRTKLWTRKLAEDFCIICGAFITIILAAFVVALWILINYGESYKADLVKFDSAAESNGCSFWTHGNQRLELVRLGEAVENSYWLYLLSYLFVLTPAVFVLCVNVTASLAAIHEISFVVGEQLNYIQLALIYSDLLRINKLESAQTCGVDLSSSAGSFDLGYSRYLAVNNCHWYPLRQLDRLKLSDACRSIERSSTRAQCNQSALDPFADLINKIYVRNRLIKSMAQESSGQVSIVLSFAYAASYGAVILVTYINRKFSYSSVSPIALAVIGLIVTNIIVVAVSQVQSNTNRLIQMMWRLIAATSCFTDIRIRHTRHLWIKQVLVLNYEGTMKVTAFGLPVTYTSLIEAVVWSSTIAIFSYY